MLQMVHGFLSRKKPVKYSTMNMTCVCSRAGFRGFGMSRTGISHCRQYMSEIGLCAFTLRRRATRRILSRNAPGDQLSSTIRRRRRAMTRKRQDGPSTGTIHYIVVKQKRKRKKRKQHDNGAYRGRDNVFFFFFFPRDYTRPLISQCFPNYGWRTFVERFVFTPLERSA